MKRNKVRYSEIIPKTREWPIVKLSKNRKKFVSDVAGEAIGNILERKKNTSLLDELETTVYKEKLRIRANPWRVDPKDESKYWNTIQRRVQESQNTSNPREAEEAILKDIVNRYANEIAGNFRKSSYRFAKGFITFGFARLLNAARVKGFLALFSRQLDLDDKIRIIGETEHIRELAKKGTVVMVPTHLSNLDSILIGWVIQFLGLPAFIYGAGLNLFNIKIIAYFMDSLGAYKVDRRKKNPIYLETLKTYSNQALRWGCHSLFFPGGTRSRSGKIEKNLKMGLLSTAIEAQRTMYQKDGDKAKKVFIVPVSINYQFTLEAPVLIKDYLKSTGQERYYDESDEFSTSYKIATFLLKFFTKGSDISVTIGKGLDIMGNYVDMAGHSQDKNGNPIHTRDYFISGGEITVNEQRENTYVRLLAKRIVEEYHKINEVFPSHIVAFTAFKLLQKRNPKMDLYDVLRLPNEDLTIPYEEFREGYEIIRNEIVAQAKSGSVMITDQVGSELDESINQGLKNVGMYHAQRPLIRKNGSIIVQDSNTLYYYHNRLEGYGFEKNF